MGIQLRNREFSALGEEAFVAPNTTFQWGVFAVEEIDLDPVIFEVGGRYDQQKTKTAEEFICGGVRLHINSVM